MLKEKPVTKTSKKNFSFLNDKIPCSTHKNQEAKSFCSDCKVFCCLADSCGQAHIYHNMENFEYLLLTQIIPLVTNFTEISETINKNYNNQVDAVNDYRNNLKSFAIGQKRKIDESYKKLIEVINNLYNFYMEDMNDFIESLSGRFDNIYEKIESNSKKNKECKNKYINI
jgi:hypothetical protein